MAPTSSGARGRPLKGDEWRLLLVLGLPGFGLALAITTVSTYLPVIAAKFTGSSTVIGLLIGAEGLLALFLPLAVGAWSDRLRTNIGSRLPFVIAGTPVLVLGLLLMGVAGGLALLAVAVVVFFGAYFIAYEPYRALYPDLAENEIAGRAQSGQAVARGAGTAAALGMGGVLLAVADVLPFAVVAAVLMVTIGVFAHIVLTRRMVTDGSRDGVEHVGSAFREIFDLVREHRALRPYMVANALWELSLAAIKTFVVLYVTVGLGYSLSATSGIIGTTALVILLAAVVSGRLADRYGTARVMGIALVVYGVGLVVPFTVETTWIILAAVPLIAFGGGVLMALPYALLMPMMPKGQHGLVTGFYGLSRGIGVTLGPLLAGVAIDTGLTPVDGAAGYPAVFGVAGFAVLASLPFLRAVVRQAEPAG